MGGAPTVLSASVKAEGRSGVRRIRIRDFQIISDSGPDFAGYNSGPFVSRAAAGRAGKLPDPYLLDPGGRTAGFAGLVRG